MAWGLVARTSTAFAAASGLEQWTTGYGLRRGLSSVRLNDPATTIAASAIGMARAMWYAIEGHDGNDVLAQRLAARGEHLARLHALRDTGRLLLAGPCPAIDAEDPGPAGFSGSIVIAEFASLDEARDWAQADPYIAAGVYTRVDVRPFKPVLP
jgi:uncharacterized protein YciI